MELGSHILPGLGRTSSVMGGAEPSSAEPRAGGGSDTPGLLGAAGATAGRRCLVGWPALLHSRGADCPFSSANTPLPKGMQPGPGPQGEGGERPAASIAGRVKTEPQTPSRGGGQVCPSGVDSSHCAKEGV